MAASTRQRLLQYVPALSAAGISIEHHALLDDDYVRRLATGERYPKRRLARAYRERLAQVIGDDGSDVLWIYAELFPYLPASFERLAFRSGKPVVYDFDDAFFHQYDDNPRPFVRRALRGKLQPLIEGAAICCCGNEYLRSYAARLRPDSIVLPTVVDTDAYTPRAVDREGPVRVGWIGSPSTWQILRDFLPMLQDVCRSRGALLRIVGAGAAAEGERGPAIELVEWTEETEIDSVRNMDVGIMPLRDVAFQRGKSGYKLIQYMACGLPVVASPVGVNAEIVRHGENGLLASCEQDWRDALGMLIDDAAARRTMGAAGRQRVEQHYSLATTAPHLIEIMREARASAGRKRPRSDERLLQD